MPKSNKFCPLPWLHSYVGNAGFYQACCINDEYNIYNRSDKTGKSIHISDGLSHQEIMNTKYMKELRLSLLAGEFPEECSRCKVTEALGGTSRRMTEVDQYQDKVQDLIENTAPDGTIDQPIIHADYRLGNTCNLQCRMCGPNASSKWIKDYEKLPDHLYNYSSRNRIEDFKKINWQQSSILLQEFEEKAGALERLHFAGGEAFLIPGMEIILQKCIDSGESKNMTLSYNTNLTILPKSLLEKWKQFKEVKLLISIDGVEALNDYIRYPSKWKDIDRNLKFLDDHHLDFNITEILISTTVQMNNILHLNKLYKYLENFKFVIPIPNLVVLNMPSYLSLLALPKKLRMIASVQLEDLRKNTLKKMPQNYEYLAGNLEGVKKRLILEFDKDEQKKLFQKFVEFNQIYDQKRGIELLKVNPEFAYFIS